MMIKIGKKISSTLFSSCSKEKSEGCEAKKITWKYAVQDYCKRDGLSRRLTLHHLHSVSVTLCENAIIVMFMTALILILPFKSLLSRFLCNSMNMCAYV